VVGKWADQYAVALVYPSALVVSTLVVDGRADRDRILAVASTDLGNLAEHPARSLVVSAFLSTESLLAWVLFAAIGLVVLGWTLGAWRTAMVALIAHVAATLISQGINLVLIERGERPEALRHELDVGPSYVVVAVLAGAILAGRWPGRLASAAGLALLAPSLFGGLSRYETAAVGHVGAIVIGFGAAALLGRSRARPLTGRAGLHPRLHPPRH
jgi:undecaprenyl pyrophosphate phosphatase UppP